MTKTREEMVADLRHGSNYPDASGSFTGVKAKVIANKNSAPLGVTDLAIQAHEKGESEHDIFHIIEFDESRFRIKKRSRVTDLDLDLTLGEEFRQTLPGDRIKTVLATSDDPGRSVRITSRMPTMNGMATVVDTKTLQREGPLLVLVQTLVIRNERSGKEHTTVRYFVPHEGEIGPAAVTAKGTGLKLD